MRKLLLVAVFAIFAAPGAARAAGGYVQAESYTDFYDAGYIQIRSYLGILEGLDYPGEWTEYLLPPLPYGTYQVHMRCWGDPVPYILHLVTYPVQGEEPQTIEIQFTGKGSSCT